MKLELVNINAEEHGCGIDCDCCCSFFNSLSLLYTSEISNSFGFVITNKLDSGCLEVSYKTETFDSSKLKTQFSHVD